MPHAVGRVYLPPLIKRLAQMRWIALLGLVQDSARETAMEGVIFYHPLGMSGPM